MLIGKEQTTQQKNVQRVWTGTEVRKRVNNHGNMCKLIIIQKMEINTIFSPPHQIGKITVLMRLSLMWVKVGRNGAWAGTVSSSFLPREAHNPQGTISLHWRPTSWTDSLSLLDNCQPSLGLPMFQALCWPFYLLNLPDHPRRYVISLYQIMTKTDLMFCEVTLYGQDNSPLVESLRFIVVAQSLSHIQLFATSWAAACQVSWSFTTSQVRWVGDVIQHLSPPSPLALNLSQHQRFHS